MAVIADHIEAHSGTRSHARIQGRCFRKLDEYCDGRGIYAGTGLRCRLSADGPPRIRVPEVAVVIGARFTQDGYLDGAPDLAVEVRSPSDRITELVSKFSEYFANGSRLGWMIVPEDRTVFVLNSERKMEVCMHGSTVSGGTVLPGLRFPVDYLFG